MPLRARLMSTRGSDFAQVMYGRSGNFMCDTQRAAPPLLTHVFMEKYATVAAARMPDPINDCAGNAKKLFTTIPAATTMKMAVVTGCPGIGAISPPGSGSRCLTIISAPAVNPKNSQSANTTYDNN